MDSLILILRVLLALGAVLAVLVLAHRYARRTAGPGTGEKLLKVLARQGVGSKAAVVVVETGGQRLLLGVTEQSVTLLSTSDAPAPQTAEPGAEAFSRVLHQATAGKHRSAAPTGPVLSPAALKQVLTLGLGGPKG
ncbi:FliO/MopB family protein [Arthrobacter sp. TMN-37]